MNQPWGRRPQYWKKQHVLVETGLLVALILALPAILRQHGQPAPSQRIELVASNDQVRVHGLTFPWYVRNQQWRADLRTLSAALRYLAEPGPRIVTNSVAEPGHDA